MSQLKKCRESEISSTAEGISMCGPAVALPPEMLTHLLEMYCKNLELDELKKLRLVSKAWRDALETLWRKRVTVCLLPFDINKFTKIVEKPSFNYQNCPLKKFQITEAEFNKYPEDMNEFWGISATSITHLELKLPTIGNFHKLLEIILLKLVNMEKFSLLTAKLLSEVATQDTGTLVNIKRKKLTYFKLAGQWYGDSSSTAKEFPYPLTWYQFLSSFPNLQQLEILSDGPIYFEDRDVYDHRHCLEAVKTLSLEGGLQYLQHLKIWREDLIYENESSCRKSVTDICQSNLPSLESLHIGFKLSSGILNNLVSRMVLEKFGSNLKQLCLHLPIYMSQVFPFRQRLEKLENLSVSCDIAYFIRNAKYFPNLKSFGVLNTSCVVGRPTATIIWLDNINDLTKIRWSQNHELRKEKALPPPIHNYDGSSEDDEEGVHEDENFQVPGRYIRTRGLGFLFEGYKRLRGSLIFVNVTSLRLDYKIRCKFFKKAPKWMPNVTTLEAALAACTFPVVCDKWRNLQKLTLLQDFRDRYNDPFLNDKFVPVDDCAIVGRKHLTSADFRCSFATTTALENCDPSQFSETKDADNSIIPNISYLTHLKYFKMQTGEAKVIEKDFDLSDASALHGFYKLPQLEYLEIIADLKPETIQELFKRIPRCIVYQSHIFDDGSADRDARKYYGMRNFNLGKW